MERRRHAVVGDDHLGRELLRARDQLVVIAGRADNGDVSSHAQERAQPLTHDQAVVGQQHADPSLHMRIGRGDSRPGKAASTPVTRWLALPQRRLPTPSTARAARPTLWRGGRQMKFESSVTAVSWIPFEAVKGFLAMPFDMGLAHYDEPLPARLDDLDEWHHRDLFREANELLGWIEVEDGKVTAYGQSGGGRIGVTRLKLGPKSITVKAKAMPELRPEPDVTDTYVRFQPTFGGRTGVPAPRPDPPKPV